MKKLSRLLCALSCAIAPLASAQKLVDAPSPTEVANKIQRSIYHFNAFPNGSGELPFLHEFVYSSLAQSFIQSNLRYQYEEADFPIPFNYAGNWTGKGVGFIGDKQTSFSYGFAPLEQYTRSYFAEKSAFKRRKMLKELPAIEEKIKAIPPFKFTNGNRFLVELPLKNFGQFDFGNMTKLLGIRYLECDPYSTHVVINHDSIFMSNPFSNFDGEPLKFNHSFASLPASITQHFVPDTRDCTFNMPFDDEEVAEQIDVAAADGSLSIWGVVNYDSDVKWGIPTGRVESLIFAKAKLTRESRDYQFITEVKATDNDTWPTYIEHLQAEHGHALSKLKKDKTGQKLAVYQRDIALLKSTAGKAFYDISNHKSDNRNARKSTVFGGFNPENGYFEVLFSGGTLGNTAYSSLVQYELVEYEGMLTGVLKHVVAGGNRRIPKVLLFDVSSGHQPLFYIRYRCERYQCGSTNFKLNNGFSYSQFQEWKAAATKKQVL